MAKRGCFKFGCFGCLGLVGLLFVIFVVLAAISVVLGPPEERFEDADLNQSLPSTVLRQPVSTETGDLSTDARPEIGPLSLLEQKPGRIELDISFAEFDLVAGDPGEPLRVTGGYDAGSYELTGQYGENENGSWTFKLKFGRRVSWLRSMIVIDGEESHNRVRLVVPRGVPITFTGKVGIGESVLDLGGLTVDDVDLDIGIGAHELLFSEPLSRPMGDLALRASIGELTVGDVGNASPRSVTLKHRIGEVRVDLRGEWKTDSDVSLRCGLGECGVRVPDDVHVDLEHALLVLGESDTSSLRHSEEIPEDAPTLHLSLSSKIGELRVTR